MLEIINATASIATAITKAKETINKTQTQNLDSTLSLINLEKSIRKQEQKTNQMIKSLHSRNTHQQKNLNISYMKGSAASPEKKDPVQKPKQKK